MIKKLTRNPWYTFLPFLVYYGYIVIKSRSEYFYGDEVRYWDFAKNLLHGFYSPPAPHINLWNGPGYPITLMPFVALNTPSICMLLMNAVYLYLALVFLYKAIKLVANHKIALIFSLLLAVYPNASSILPLLFTEALTYFLIASFVYCAALCYVNQSKKYGLLAGVLLGFLTLTKIVFGYVLVISLAACLFMLLFKKNRLNYLQSVKILVIAFIVSMPYLVYTYHLTGKVFYWGNSGGMSLYWMSTPYEHEYGDWKVPDLTNNQYPALFKPSATVVGLLNSRHSKEMKFILKHNEIERDALFKQIAIENIKKNPLKFIKNYYANFSRMLFNFPYSYSYQDAAIVGNILIGSSILWASVIGIVLTIINWRHTVFALRFVLLVTGVYLMLSGALSSYPRQLDVILPVLLFWLGYLAGNLKKIDLKFMVKENVEEVDLVELAGATEING